MPGEAYYSCDWIEGGLGFNRRSLHTCLIAHAGGGLPSICDYAGGEIPLQEILQAREAIRKANRNGGYPQCRGCAYLQKKVWRQRPGLFHIVGIAHFSLCNIECKYCYLQVQDPLSWQSGRQPYRLLGRFRELIDRGLLAEGAIIDWGGGEPTLYYEFDRLFQLLDRHACRQFIHTNGTHIPACFRGHFAPERVHIVCSVDAGFPETYQTIKNRDLLPQVWRNLERFKTLGCAVTVKYIVTDENSSPEELDTFLARLQEFGASTVVVDLDYNQPKPSAAVINGIVHLQRRAALSGLHPAFGFTGARFRFRSDVEECVHQEIRRLCEAQIRNFLAAGYATADRRLDRFAHLYALHSQGQHSSEFRRDDAMLDLLATVSKCRSRELRAKDQTLERLQRLHRRLSCAAAREIDGITAEIQARTALGAPSLPDEESPNESSHSAPADGRSGSAPLIELLDHQMEGLERREQFIRQLTDAVRALETFLAGRHPMVWKLKRAVRALRNVWLRRRAFSFIPSGSGIDTSTLKHDHDGVR